MRAVLQRVDESSVTVEDECVSKIGKGLLILLGVEKGDSEKDIVYLVEKVTNLRIFEDSSFKFNLSLLDVGGEALVVSQFTLLGDARKGRRPSFSDACRPEEAERLYLDFADKLKSFGVSVQTGVFGAMMNVSLINNGPVTILLDSKKNF